MNFCFDFSMALRVVKLSPDAFLPSRPSAQTAAFELFSNEYCEIRPGERCLVKTGIAVELPPGCYGRVAPLTEHALQFGLDVAGGVWDRCSKEEVCVVIFNHGELTVKIRPGQKIAYMVCEKVASLCVEQLSSVEEMRGESVTTLQRRGCLPLLCSLLFRVILHFEYPPPVSTAKRIIAELRVYFDHERDFRARDRELPPACYVGCTYSISDCCLSIDVNVSGSDFQTGEEEIIDDLRERTKYALARLCTVATVDVFSVPNCFC